MPDLFAQAKSPRASEAARPACRDGQSLLGERIEYFRVNQQIHDLIVNATDNPILINMYNPLSARIHRARYMATLSPERWDQAVNKHEQMLRAIEARNCDRLEHIQKEHLEHDSNMEHLINNK